MMQQYFRAKAEHPEALIAMRVGDFYEFYGEDAETAAQACEITLTGRDDGGERMPMAGVPYHSADKYLARLVAKGYKVGICEQLEDPKLAKGLVKRGVVRVLTPGTVTEDSMLSAGANNYLVAIFVDGDRAGFAILDSSTGDFQVTEVEGTDFRDRIVQELGRVCPRELLVSKQAEELGEVAAQAIGTTVSPQDAPYADRAAEMLRRQFRVANLQGFGIEDRPAAVVAASMILAYAEKAHVTLDHLDGIASYSLDGYMRLDMSTRRSLEITQNLGDGSRRHTLLAVLDETVTPMGARLLRRWLDLPLLDRATIRGRLEAVRRMAENSMARRDLREALGKLYDLERLATRAANGTAGPRDLAALRQSLLAMPALADPLRKLGVGRIQELREQLVDHSELTLLLDRALVAEPPHHLRDGGVIRPGYDLELDKLRELNRDGKSFIASLEAREREATGIGTLKVGFNSVFGYYLEVSKANLDKVPPTYIRKQTTAGAERYITAELKEHESQVLGAEEKAVTIEADLFNRLRGRVAGQSQALIQTARALAELDLLANLAEVGLKRGYVEPEIAEDDGIEIVGGRHPVVEAAAPNFVPNDLALHAGQRLMILTGPNMAGKSTFLRQAALIVLLAQCGSFVPAQRARIGLCDRIFARIGAKDELALGQSTFMVEMVESANIMHHATPQSLVILDEVGRGTSTFDGLAIAWAMVERLAEIGAKTLFATHYHQLNALAERIETIANFRVAIEEIGDDIVWTHRVLPGGTDRSYGIHVARMAGIPARVLHRAATILADLEATEASPKPPPMAVVPMQLQLFEAEPPPVMAELTCLDVNQLTPLEALRVLDDWKRRFST